MIGLDDRIREREAKKMTRQEIMKDLREIRYYYSRKKGFDELKNEIESNIIAEKVQRYNDAVKRAPIRIYGVYVELYIRNNTQESLADKWRYSTQTIKRLNGKLYDYLQANLR